MIELARNPYYNSLKEGLLAGMDGKHFQSYCSKIGTATVSEKRVIELNNKLTYDLLDRILTLNLDNKLVNELFGRILKFNTDTKTMYNLLDRMLKFKIRHKTDHPVMSVEPSNSVLKGMIERNDNVERLPNIKRYLISDMLNKGRSTPLECFAAWYDALAEFASEKAYEKIGVEAPITVINEELNKLQEKLACDEEYLIAKEELVKRLKELFPTEYKQMLKECQQSFKDKIDATISDIVAIVTGKSSISAKK